MELEIVPWFDNTAFQVASRIIDEEDYQPCIAALFGTNIGANPDTEPQYFLAYEWLTHNACGYFSCLADNMRWDCEKGGCIPSGITGDTNYVSRFCRAVV